MRKKDRSPEERFSYVIEQASLKTGKGVVVLVDEYDKPLLQAITRPNLFEDYRQTLKAFYGVLKKRRRISPFCFPDRSYEVLTSQRIQRFESVE